jgi:APA family basic amino acid/polyamine antiporter
MSKDKSKVLSLSEEPIKRSLTVLDMFAIGYGDLGSSIYYALGLTALFALGATPIALMLAGLVFVCTALTYAEMTSCFKDSGGSASFARHAFNDLISFVAGWGLLLDYIVTIAISAFSIAPYLSYFFPELSHPSFQVGLTTGIIIILFFINLFGVKESTRISLALTIFTLLTQTVIVAIASFASFDLMTLLENMKINSGGPVSPTWPEFWKGTAMAMVAYTGIESIAQLGAEAKKPKKNVPKAVVLTMYVLVAMYFMLSIVALSSITPHELATTYQQDPIAGIVAKLPFGSTVLGPWLGLLAACLLFVAANAGLIGASRLSFNLGEYYQLPRFFYKLNNRFKTPQNALLIFALLSCIIVVASRGELSFLADLYNFGAMLAFTSAHFSLIALRIKYPNMARPYRLPFNIKIKNRHIPISAVVGGLSTLSVWVLVIVTKPQGRYLGIAWMLFGLGMYLYYRKFKKLNSSGTIAIEKVAAPKFKGLKINKILVALNHESDPSNLLKIALDTAVNHSSKLKVVQFIDIPYTAPLDTHIIDADNLGLKSWQALAESKDLSFSIEVARTRKLDEALEEFIDDEKIDLFITSDISKQLLKKLKNKAKVWVCN